MTAQRWQRIYWVLFAVSVAVMAAVQYWESQRPTDAEVQQRMQEGIKSKEITDQWQAIQDQRDADQRRRSATDK
ncbi:MAG TPA: hypothetical protein VG713_16715 [Pirellulales bacterium]|nr:hypothetical protein [Pirellulales bacterium]